MMCFLCVYMCGQPETHFHIERKDLYPKVINLQPGRKRYVCLVRGVSLMMKHQQLHMYMCLTNVEEPQLSMKLSVEAIIEMSWL